MVSNAIRAASIDRHTNTTNKHMMFYHVEKLVNSRERWMVFRTVAYFLAMAYFKWEIFIGSVRCAKEAIHVFYGSCAYFPSHHNARANESAVEGITHKSTLAVVRHTAQHSTVQCVFILSYN